jgi:UPF0288 family protein (methanogenesis marker protein 3)
MAFETFSRKSAGKSTDPFVTIQRRGTFSINSAAAKMLSGGQPFEKLPIELLFDREEKAVGLRKAPTDSPDVYYMRKQPSSDSYILSGQAFTQFYKIDTSISRRYRVRLTEEGILTFRLGDKHVEVERTGRPAKGELPPET